MYFDRMHFQISWLSKQHLIRQKEIDLENNILLTKILYIMKRRNKSLSNYFQINQQDQKQRNHSFIDRYLKTKEIKTNSQFQK
jgi:hypothetical protein